MKLVLEHEASLMCLKVKPPVRHFCDQLYKKSSSLSLK